MDADPPRFEARRATQWLIYFMTHVASCGAGAVIKNSQEPGASFTQAPLPGCCCVHNTARRVAADHGASGAFPGVEDPGSGSGRVPQRGLK